MTDAVSLLGMDAAKKWIFISNAPDTTLLRNALSRKLAGQLDLAQSKDGVFVDLYLNGEYAGNYYVTEKVEVHKNPLPITDMEKVAELTNNNEEFNVYETAWTDSTKAKDVPKDPVDITGGYFLLPERYQSLFGDGGAADASAAGRDDRRVRGYGQGSVVGTVCGEQYMGEP